MRPPPHVFFWAKCPEGCYSTGMRALSLRGPILSAQLSSLRGTRERMNKVVHFERNNKGACRCPEKGEGDLSTHGRPTRTPLQETRGWVDRSGMEGEREREEENQSTRGCRSTSWLF